jgi:hypothetical protein
MKKYLYTEKAIKDLETYNRKLEELIAQCRTLTGSLWPQNETTVELARILGK